MPPKRKRCRLLRDNYWEPEQGQGASTSYSGVKTVGVSIFFLFGEYSWIFFTWIWYFSTELLGLVMVYCVLDTSNFYCTQRNTVRKVIGIRFSIKTKRWIWNIIYCLSFENFFYFSYSNQIFEDEIKPPSNRHCNNSLKQTTKHK